MHSAGLGEGCRPSLVSCRRGELPALSFRRLRGRRLSGGSELRAAGELTDGEGHVESSLSALEADLEVSHTASTLEASCEASESCEQIAAFQVEPAPPGPYLIHGPPGTLDGLSPALPPGGSWVWAAAILIAARLGRVTAQEARLDIRQLQFERERSRALSKELLQRRREYELAEGERSAVEAARRVEEEAARALEEFRRQQELQRKYQESAAREAERLRAEQDAKRQQYEAEQARLDAEYQARLEQERKLIEEQRARAAAAEAEKRRAEEERKRQQEEERRAREEQERREREEAIRRRLEERRRLEREKKRFALRLEGSVAADRPPKGTVLPGPLQKEATLRLTAAASSLLGGAGAPAVADFVNPGDALEALPGLAARSARAGADAYASAVRLQSMTGEGPAAWMDEVELRHWMALAATRAALEGARAGEGALQRVPSSQPFQSRTEYGVLPADHPQRTPLRFARVIGLIEGGSAAEAKSLLLEGDLAEEASAQLYSDLGPLPAAMQPAPAQLLPTALLCSHLLDRCLHDRPAKVSDAPAWFESAAATIRECLQASAAGAPPDSLQAPASLLGGLLGVEHPVAAEAARLAEGNLSATTRRLREERERIAKAELAAKLLEEEWPDAEEIKAARLAEKEASTPIPERVWALRNVAGTLAMGGPSERGRARKLLEQAVLLKQQYAGAPDHPGALPELVALLDLLAGEQQWRADAVGVAALIMAVLRGVADAYAAAGDPVSATVVLEVGLRRYDELLGVRHPAVNSALRRVEGLSSALSPEQRATVAQWRSKADQVLARLCEAFTEPLQAYQTGRGPSRVGEWDSKGVAWLGRFQ